MLLVRQEHQHWLKTADVVADTQELFQEIMEATADLAALALIILAAEESPLLRLLHCGAVTAAKAVAIPVQNAKDCLVVVVDAALRIVWEAEAVAVVAAADSIKVASVTHPVVADVAPAVVDAVVVVVDAVVVTSAADVA